MRRFTLLALGAFCLGCGSRPNDAPPAPRATAGAPPATIVPNDPRPVIAAFGDSLSAGYGVAATESYPYLLQQKVDGAGLRYRVVNLGVSGDTTNGGVSRVASVVELKPKLVILELGANDGLRGLPVSATRANLETMITEIRKTEARIVLAGMTLPRNYGADYIGDFEKVFVDLARQHQLVRIPFFLAGIATDQNLMQPDGLHPNPAGQEVLARNVFDAIRPLL